LAAALREEQHDRRVMAIPVHPGKELAVQRFRKLVLWRNDEAARRDEIPATDLLGNEILEFLRSKIVQAVPRLAPRGEAGSRTEQEPKQNFSPIRLGLREVVEHRFHARACSVRRTNSGAASLSTPKIVTRATENIRRPAKSWRKPCAAASPK